MNLNLLQTPLKEGDTPIKFLMAYGKAFQSCFEHDSQRRLQTAAAHQRMMFICADAVWVLQGKHPKHLAQNREEVVACLKEFRQLFEALSNDPTANIHAVGRRIAMIDKIIDEIMNLKPKLVQTGLFS